jgi:hypothetical protein
MAKFKLKDEYGLPAGHIEQKPFEKNKYAVKDLSGQKIAEIEAIPDYNAMLNQTATDVMGKVGTPLVMALFAVVTTVLITAPFAFLPLALYYGSRIWRMYGTIWREFNVRIVLFLIVIILLTINGVVSLNRRLRSAIDGNGGAEFFFIVGLASLIQLVDVCIITQAYNDLMTVKLALLSSALLLVVGIVGIVLASLGKKKASVPIPS